MVSLPYRIRETGEGSDRESEPEKTLEREQNREGTNPGAEGELERRIKEFQEKIVAEEEESRNRENSDALKEHEERIEPPERTLSDFEEKVLDAFEEFGIDREKAKAHWTEGQIENIEDALCVSDKERAESDKETHEFEEKGREKSEPLSEYAVTDEGGGLVCALELGQGEESSLVEVEGLQHEDSGPDETNETNECAAITEEQVRETEQEAVEATAENQGTISDSLRALESTRSAEEEKGNDEPVFADSEKVSDERRISTTSEDTNELPTESTERAFAKSNPEVVEESTHDESIELDSDDSGELAEYQGDETELHEGRVYEHLSNDERIRSGSEGSTVDPSQTEAHTEVDTCSQELIEAGTESQDQELDEEEHEAEEMAEECPPQSGNIMAGFFPEGDPVIKPMLPEGSHFGLFPETEEDRVRARLKELFDSLSEEEKEEVREFIRSEVESVEELEELIALFPECQYDPDFKTTYEEAVEYVRTRQEVRSEKDSTPPRLIQEIRNREAERRWAEIVLLGTRDGGSPTKREVVPDDTHDGQEVAPKNRRYRPHTGKPRPVRLCQPVVMGRKIRSTRQLENIIAKHHPGLMERKDIRTLMTDASTFFELKEALRGHTAVRQHEVDEIGKRLHITKDTARGRVFYGQTPLVFQILNERLSIGEAKLLLRKYRVKLRGITCWEDVQRRLDKMYPGKEYEQIPDYATRKEAALGFFPLMEMLEGGGSTKELARRANMSVRTARYWMSGEIPWLARHVLPRSSSSGNRQMRHLQKVKMRFPVIRGKEIRSIEELRTLIEHDFPAIKERKDYEELVHTAEQYFIVKAGFSSRAFFRVDELPELEKRTRRSTETVKQWLIGKAFPMVFNLLGDALSLKEAQSVLHRLVTKLNGVTSFDIMMKRLSTLYTLEDLKTVPGYAEDTKNARRFFLLIETLAKGGLTKDMARRSGLAVNQPQKWLLEYSRPRLIRTAAQIPAREPRDGYKWLPMRILPPDTLKDFVQVPVEIRSPQDLYAVLRQIKSIKSPQMTQWMSRFGSISKRTAFMYALGSIISDGGFHRRIGTSFPVFISLSSGYAWSEKFGEAFSYCLGKNGIVCKFEGPQKKKSGPPQLLWRTMSSPFFIWVMRTLLGLGKASKTNSEIRADWVLMLDRGLRVTLLQGWADGDGYASVRGFAPGISTKMNKPLVRDLLSSLGIASNMGSNGVLINRERIHSQSCSATIVQECQ